MGQSEDSYLYLSVTEGNIFTKNAKEDMTLSKQVRIKMASSSSSTEILLKYLLTILCMF